MLRYSVKKEGDIRLELKDKVVLVTGGSTGLGEQICYEAAKQGAIVIVSARRIDLLEDVKRKCETLSHNKAYAIPVDMSNPESIQELIDVVRKTVGTVDILVNNAGFGTFEDFVSVDFEEARKMFEVNLFGMMYLTQALVIEMLPNQQGHIINLASMAGKMATPKSTIYSATKFAVIGFSNALRLELRPFNIHVTTVNPGPIQTNFFDLADPTGEYLANVDSFVLDAQKLAQEIVRNMIRPKREINRPRVMAIAAKFYAVFPKIGDYLAGGIFNQK